MTKNKAGVYPRARFIKRHHAMTVIRMMQEQLVFMCRHLKHTLSQNHAGLNHKAEIARREGKMWPGAPQLQKDLAIVKRRLKLLCVMITAGRNKLYPSFGQSANREQLLQWQDSWVYQEGRLIDNYPGAMVWWCEYQDSLRAKAPEEIKYMMPFTHTEVWEALIGPPDPEAREAAFRLGGRGRG